jgi:hypothetical protein
MEHRAALPLLYHMMASYKFLFFVHPPAGTKVANIEVRLGKVERDIEAMKNDLSDIKVGLNRIDIYITDLKANTDLLLRHFNIPPPP